MKVKTFRILLVAFTLLQVSPKNSFSQEKIIDQVVAIVGNNIILLSDIENQYLQLMAQGISSKTDLKCEILEESLIQKLLLNQALIDSIEVTEAQVDLQLNQRMLYFINQIGSEEKLEEYFNKSLIEIKQDLREVVKEQLITQKMQSEITGDIKITPSEVKDYFKRLPDDSIPYINAQIEIYQIVKYPPYSEDAIYEVKQKLLEIRERIINGEKFSKLAVLYSEGPSATRGGEIGFSTRAELDPEYAKAAFSLTEGGISRIVESAFGFHIIQLIERRDDRINTRHILMKPKVTVEAAQEAMTELDSVVRLIRADSIKFEIAAKLYSDDKNTKMNGGQLINPMTGNARFEMDQLNTRDYYIIKDLNVGEISDPFESVDDNGKVVYKSLMIKSKTKPHKANLKEDFNLLKNMALIEKREDIVAKWVSDKQKTTYIKINDSFLNCDFRNIGWIK